MLLPYQPDYKTQQSLKVPGTAASMASGRSGTNGTQGQQEGPGCVQVNHLLSQLLIVKIFPIRLCLRKKPVEKEEGGKGGFPF